MYYNFVEKPFLKCTGPTFRAVLGARGHLAGTSVLFCVRAPLHYRFCCAAVCCCLCICVCMHAMLLR